jgi:hypothetical protein
MAAREESYPRCLWIWHGLEARLCDLLVQLDSIVCARWRPNKKVEHSQGEEGEGQADEEDGEDDSIGPVLAFCCNTPRVYFWTLHGSSWADLPQMSASAATDILPKPSQRSSSSSRTSSVTSMSQAPPLPPPHGEEIKPSVVDLSVSSLKWSPDGKRLLLIGKERFCSCDVSFASAASQEFKLRKSEDQEEGGEVSRGAGQGEGEMSR